MNKYVVFSDYNPDPGHELFDNYDDAYKDFRKRINDSYSKGIDCYLAKIVLKDTSIDEND